jgi:hypothetical protein
MGDQSRAVCSTKSPAQYTIHSQISSKSQMGPYRIAGLSTGIDINGNKTSKHTNARRVDVVVKEQFELFFLANNKINLRVIKMKEIQKSGIYDKVLLKVYEAGPRKKPCKVGRKQDQPARPVCTNQGPLLPRNSSVAKSFLLHE